MDRLRTSFDVETESGFFQLPFDGGDELGDVGVSRTLCLVQLLFDEVILLTVGIFQRQVFQFAFDRVQSEAVGKRGVEVRNLRCQPFPIFVALQELAEAHQTKTVGDHNQDHAYIFSKREQQLMEVFGVDSRIAGIKGRRFQQAADDQGDIRIECSFHFL